MLRWRLGLPVRLLMVLALLYLTGMAAEAVFSAALTSKSDQRVESVTLPSGEVLENHTYLEEGWGDERHNTLFLKNPVTGASERIDDRFGYLNYEAGPSEPALLQRYPHPQEFARGGEKVLVIRPYVCKRWIWKTGPDWSIARFDMAASDAAEYLRSFFKPAKPELFSSPGSGPECFLHYQVENLDLENNILTVKRIPWNTQFDSPDFRDFPDYLVYSSIDYHGRPGYEFPWKFDAVRTRVKNGPRWEKPMPFRMVLEYSVVAFSVQTGYRPNLHEETRDMAMSRVGAEEIGRATLELSGQEPRSVDCRYRVSGTNQVIEKIEAMYGFADAQTNRFNLIWQPHNPAAWPVPGLNLAEWVLVGESGFGSNRASDEFIRLRRIEP